MRHQHGGRTNPQRSPAPPGRIHGGTQGENNHGSATAAVVAATTVSPQLESGVGSGRWERPTRHVDSLREDGRGCSPHTVSKDAGT